MGEDDLGVIPLAIYHEEDNNHFYLRTPSKFDPASGEITTFGSIEQGASVRVCTATRTEVIRGVKKAMDGVYHSGFEPVAAIVVSCAGRKWLMDDGGTKKSSRSFHRLEERYRLSAFRLSVKSVPS